MICAYLGHTAAGVKENSVHLSRCYEVSREAEFFLRSSDPGRKFVMGRSLNHYKHSTGIILVVALLDNVDTPLNLTPVSVICDHS